jgi:hypothetical protein
VLPAEAFHSNFGHALFISHSFTDMQCIPSADNRQLIITALLTVVHMIIPGVYRLGEGRQFFGTRSVTHDIQQPNFHIPS